MASSEVSISNNALLMLGKGTIASFDDGTDMARLVSNLWPDMRDALLRSHPWNFATTRVILSPDATAPAFEWPYKFTLPGDWLRTLSIGEEGQDPAFVMEGGYILFDEATLKLRYLYKETNVGRWDSMAVAAATAIMKSLITYPVTKSTSLVQLVQTEVANILRQARSINGQEDTGEVFGDSPLLTARYARSWSSSQAR